MKYNTKQKDEILKYLKNNKEHYFEVDDIINFLKENNKQVSKTTIYRYLEELKEKNIIKKFTLDNKKAMYEYLDCHDTCYHLVCNKCNKIIHINCDNLNETIKHILKEHDFVIEDKIILQGTCLKCKEV